MAPTDNTDETPAPTEGNEEPTEGTTGDVVTLKWVTVGNGMPENYDAWKANLDKYLEEKIGVPSGDGSGWLGRLGQRVETSW